MPSETDEKAAAGSNMPPLAVHNHALQLRLCGAPHNRKGMNGLAALVQEQLKADPFSGTIYCFRSKRADRVKLIFWDGTGLCLLCKRLEDGKFRWPRVQDGVMRLSAAQLSALLEGL